MLKSMTGFGKAEISLAEGKFTIEIRSLNGKNADISIKSSLLPRNREIEIRQLIIDKLYRGNIDVFINFEANYNDCGRKINTELAKEYFKQVNELQKEVDKDSPINNNAELWLSILNLPDVLESKRKEVIDESNWDAIKGCFEQAIDALDKFRIQEGEALYKDIISKVDNIEALSKEIELLEKDRIESIKNRLYKNLEELNQSIDKARFEQELIYYLEKLDINEEKVRLAQHCKYFRECLNKEKHAGKKLGFILQEIGREINTTGSKANNASIQQLVVRMKDELEKMKEQSLNIL